MIAEVGPDGGIFARLAERFAKTPHRAFEALHGSQVDAARIPPPEIAGTFSGQPREQGLGFGKLPCFVKRDRPIERRVSRLWLSSAAARPPAGFFQVEIHGGTGPRFSKG
jgi:hypothetical protein